MSVRRQALVWLVALAQVVGLSACRADAVAASDAALDASADVDSAGAACGRLFGSPNAHTGLDADACAPTCSCDGESWTPAAWDPARLDGLHGWTLLDPPQALASDPYLEPAPIVAEGSVCGVVVVDHDAKTYRVQSFASAADAVAAHAIVSHGGICGLCSSLADLAVYAGQSDLTGPVRTCGIQHADHAGDVACLEDLGFTAPCADIWAYNTAHTRSACGAICISLLSAPYNTPDGALNACLQCDEDESGAVFKAIAGRTRRNTGVPSAICRPCTGVLHLTHVYE